MRFVAIQLRVALVGGDDEVVFLGELERVAQELERQHGAGRIAGAAEEQDLAAFPDFGRHGVEIGLEAVGGSGVQEHGLRAGEQGRALIDLIERIRHRDHGLRWVPRVLTTACTNENSASRVPFTGNTMVSADDSHLEAPCEPARRKLARVSGNPAVTG